MTEKISHEAARLAVFETRPANTELLQSYITQQQALEADAVSRAEHEAALENYKENRASWLRAERDTERARAEEAERELAAANARVARLEEALRGLVHAVTTTRAWPKSEIDAAWSALSTAPQASTTEQAPPSPAVGEPRQHELNEFTVCTVCKRFDPANPCPGPAQPAPGVTERAWLIEHEHTRVPRWAVVDHSPTGTRLVRWTYSASEAIRYDERDHALDVLPLILDGEQVTVTEHEWHHDPTPAEPGGAERWDMPGAIGGANGHKAKQWASETLEPADPTPAEPGGTERWVPKVGERVRNKKTGQLATVQEPSSANWADSSNVIYDDGPLIFTIGNHRLEPADPTPAEPPPVDYVTYEVLIEALRAWEYYGLADRLEKARGR